MADIHDYAMSQIRSHMHVHLSGSIESLCLVGLPKSLFIKLLVEYVCSGDGFTSLDEYLDALTLNPSNFSFLFSVERFELEQAATILKGHINEIDIIINRALDND